MRSIRFHQFGAPEEVLQVDEVPVPVPGPSEVRVRVRARVINIGELYMVRGVYALRPPLPATPGYEGVGVVDAVGGDVRRFKVGERVTFGPQATLGTWSECVVTDEHKVVHVPGDIPDALAAQYTNLFSAWVLTTDLLQLPPGAWVMQTAANSALGNAVIQIGKVRDFKTLNVVRRRERMEPLSRAGGDAVVCTADEPLYDRVMALTGGEGVHALLDPVAGATGAEGIRCLKAGGKAIVFAGISGGKSVAVDLSTLIYKEIVVTGFFLSRWFALAGMEKVDRLTAEFWATMGKRLDAPIDGTYDLKDIRKAAIHADRFGRGGKVMLLG